MRLVEARDEGFADSGRPLDVRAVKKTFKGRAGPHLSRGLRGEKKLHTAVDGVSFRVVPAEIFGLIGANGSGKSTLIRVLSTLLVPDSGEVSVFGRDALRDPLSVRRLLNRVSADPRFSAPCPPWRTFCSTGVPTGLRVRRCGAQSKEILDRLGLERGRIREPMLHLSRGQQQKVAVARAPSSPRRGSCSWTSRRRGSTRGANERSRLHHRGAPRMTGWPSC